MSTTQPQKVSIDDSQDCADADVVTKESSAASAEAKVAGGGWRTGWGLWLKSAGDFVTSTGQDLIEAVKPDIQEFASTIGRDTRTWVHEHAPDMAAFTFDSEKANEEKTDEEGNFFSSQQIAHSSKEISKNENANGNSTVQSSGGRDETLGESSKTSSKTSSLAGSSLPKKDLLANTSAHFRSKYYQLRCSEETYLEDPPVTAEQRKLFEDYSVEQYEVLEWINDPVVADMQKSLGTMAIIPIYHDVYLHSINDRVVADMQKSLVPNRVSEELFWKRFLFQLHCLHKEEAHLAELMQRMKNTKEDEDEEYFTWEDDVTQVASSSASPRATSTKIKDPGSLSSLPPPPELVEYKGNEKFAAEESLPKPHENSQDENRCIKATAEPQRDDDDALSSDGKEANYVEDSRRISSNVVNQTQEEENGEWVACG